MAGRSVVERRLAVVVPAAVMVSGFGVTSMFINALKTRNRRTALTIPDGDGQNIETETFDEPHLQRFSKPPPSKIVLTDEILVQQAAIPRTSTAASWALKRNNCKFSLRSFCVVGSEMMGSDGL
jgi:hypothetical protein